MLLPAVIEKNLLYRSAKGFNLGYNSRLCIESIYTTRFVLLKVINLQGIVAK